MIKPDIENKSIHPRPGRRVLHYVGEGETLPGVPARDLTEHEVNLHGGYDYLISTNLYIDPDEGRE